MDTTTQSPIDASRRPRGRPPSRSWAFFTSLLEPQKLVSAECRHCNQLVHYHKKWAQARAHLMKCPQFRRLIDTSPPGDVPPWYLAEMHRRQHPFVPPHGPSVFEPNATGLARATPVPMLHSVPMAVATGMPLQPHAETVQRGSQDWATVNEHVAMHLFTTMSVAQLLEDTIELPFLWQAFRVVDTNVALCTKSMLLTSLLDQCYERVKTHVRANLQTAFVPVALSLDIVASWHGATTRLSCLATSASSATYPWYLHAVHVPRHSPLAEHMVQQVERGIASTSCPVAGCVLPMTEQRKPVLERLQARFPAMHFHGCLRYALESLLRHLFTGPTPSTPVTVPFWHELQHFALQCHDLVSLLPPHDTTVPCRHEATTDRVLASATRGLRLDDGVSAILRAQALLTPDSALLQALVALHTPAAASASPSVAAQRHAEILALVRSRPFVTKLSKYVALLRPIHTLLQSLHEASHPTVVYLSDVYGTFAHLVDAVASSDTLTDDEKTAVVALVRDQADRVMCGSAHLLAYLLDPELRATALPDDRKRRLEHELLASRRGDGTPWTETEYHALAAQYRAFTHSATTVRPTTAASRHECTLSPVHYWVTQGAQWPLLQAIACRVFAVPVCAARLLVADTCGASQEGTTEPTDWTVVDKMLFVRINARQVHGAKAPRTTSLVHRSPDHVHMDEITASMVV